MSDDVPSTQGHGGIDSTPLNPHSDSHDARGIDPLSPSSGVTPVGGIILWAQASANLPPNWKVCDGTNGTPNLQNMFVKGVGSDALGVTGGSATQATHSTHATHATHASHVHSIQQDNIGVPGAGLGIDRNTTDGYGGDSHDAHDAHSAHGTNQPPFYTAYFIMRIY